MVAIAPLLVLLMLGVLVPTAGTVAERHTATLVADRLSDASRFSVLALTALTGGTALQADLVRLRAELDEYADLYDTPMWFLDREQQVLHATDGTPPPAEATARLTGVLAGQLPPVERTVWPWRVEPELVVTPVGRDSQVVAALVLAVPTDSVRARILGDWALLGGLFALVATLAVWLVGPMTRWILRPVADLERSAAAVRAGQLDTRAAPDSGPPELRNLSAGFNDMVDAVRRTIERQQRFVADAAHQLRNPIASVRLSVENLEPHLGTDADARVAYSDAVDDLERMSSVLSSMLAATAVADRPAGAGPVGAAIGQRGSSWRAVVEDAGMTFAEDLAGTSTRVREPTGGLAAAVDELVANAVRLSRGSTVTVRGRPDGSGYRIEVADDGRGLDENGRRRATERFWRSPHDQNVPGTGLGLAIVAQVLDDAGGALELAETPGGGLTAVVRVPPAT
ncbi:signal transduction histidine kinase [Pseudonocardia autotrophica]|uniref:histidine kinase n=2 Tax=Pseudonocardia TaxID=1847 RepID=A0A1Y2MVK0_PSEAH|nr:Sensor protein CpxA [Pseudonocardia autotrophica]TDN76573.1 signal transduction histidine kinase [Pseudonocardia autotrophica]GEC28475.1 two-component sensor histidine kinase [Pseudonocardia saturnea]